MGTRILYYEIAFFSCADVEETGKSKWVTAVIVAEWTRYTYIAPEKELVRIAYKLRYVTNTRIFSDADGIAQGDSIRQSCQGNLWLYPPETLVTQY